MINDNSFFFKYVEDIHVYIAFKKDHVTFKKIYLLPYLLTIAVIKLENNKTLVNITRNKNNNILFISFSQEIISYHHRNISFQEIPKILEPATMNLELLQRNEYLNIPNHVHILIIIIVCYLFIYHIYLNCSRIKEFKSE